MARWVVMLVGALRTLAEERQCVEPGPGCPQALIYRIPIDGEYHNVKFFPNQDLRVAAERFILDRPEVLDMAGACEDLRGNQSFEPVRLKAGDVCRRCFLDARRGDAKRICLVQEGAERSRRGQAADSGY